MLNQPSAVDSGSMPSTTTVLDRGFLSPDRRSTFSGRGH
jgi:hypothetical protein